MVGVIGVGATDNISCSGNMNSTRVAKREHGVKNHPSARWYRMAEIYKLFAAPWNSICDFSKSAAQEMYIYESTGHGLISPNNGFAIGKRWMDVTIKMWKWSIKEGLLFPQELYQDSELPHWFLRRCGIP